MSVPEGPPAAASAGPPDDMGPMQQSEDLSQARRRALRRSLGTSPFYMFAVLIAIFIVFTIVSPNAFPSSANVHNILLDAAVFMVMAMAMTYVMIAAGIDLSVGSVLVFGNVIAAKTMIAVGGDNAGTVIIGLLAGVAAGGGWGLFNGLCITKLRVPALITTLGTLGAALGAADLLTGGNDVRTVPLTLINFGTDTFLGVSYIIWSALAVTLIGGFVLHSTRYGRHTYIIGSNIETARRAGINVDRHLLSLYAMAGAAAGFAGFLSLAQFASTTISGHSQDVLAVITGVVLGGTSLFGGMGWMVGTVIGILIPATLDNGFVIANLQSFWQQVATGLILIGAVYLDQIKRRSRERA